MQRKSVSKINNNIYKGQILNYIKKMATIKTIRRRVMTFNIISVVLFFMAVAWNISTGGLYNLEIAIGALVLGLIKIWQEFLN